MGLSVVHAAHYFLDSVLTASALVVLIAIVADISSLRTKASMMRWLAGMDY